MSLLSVTINFNNQTSKMLVNSVFVKQEYGDWDPVPPVIILPNSTVSWKDETSNVIVSYVEGCVAYIDENRNQIFEMGWKDMLFGTNTYTQTVASGYTLIRTGGDGGDNTTANYTLTEQA